MELPRKVHLSLDPFKPPHVIYWLLSPSYDTARKIKESQDEYCSKAIAGQWEGLGEFPEDLQWEALVDVLRGRVKVIIALLLSRSFCITEFADSNPLL